MKKKFFKRFAYLLVMLSILFSFSISIGALDEVIDFDSEVIPGASTPLGGLTDITYTQGGEIGTPFDPKNKDVVFLVDSSYNMTESETDGGPFDHVLFSRNTTTVGGPELLIEGKFFNRDTVTTSNNEIAITDTYECGLWQDTSGNEDGNPPIDGERITGKDLDRFEHWFPDSEDAYGVPQITQLLDSIGNNARELHEIYGVTYFDERDEDFLNTLPIDLEENVELDYKEFHGEDTFVIEGDGTFIINSDMYFHGNLAISTRTGIRQAPEILGDEQDAYIMATGNVTLQGQEMTEIDNVNLISMNSDVKIQLAKNQFKGLALAPRGKMEFIGEEGAEYIGSFIADELSIGGNYNFRYPDENTPSDRIRIRTYTEAAPLINQNVNRLINTVDEYTTTTTIPYSTRANSDIETDLNVNLGDGLRHSYHHLSESASPDKYIVVFTGRAPNTYTNTSAHSDEFLLTGNAQGHQISDDTNKAIDYAKEVVDHNGSEDVQLIFVDLTEALSGTEEEEVANLYSIANNIGVSDDNYVQPSTLSETDFNLNSLNLSSLQEAIEAPIFESLTAESAIFEAELPLNLVVTQVQYGFGNDIEDIDYQEFDITENEGEVFNIDDNNTVTFNVPNFSTNVELIKEDTLFKLSKSIYLKLFVIVRPDEPDEFENINWVGSPPIMTGILTLEDEHAKIDYLFKDDSDNTYNASKKFEEADIEVEHSIDLN
ncbi:hypothetical protein RBH29_08965 [Herbivorax sp. ANBcel31]|uniref:hypothetical protein n=1 Tax=Herbivorax sp. ANBcel31 TaxID=3069754 RepID=UPI0027B81232|nr:hypothetical protein [Herbivorax sp. ANBcel31]MDQ2086553.1 hypothetical protein [Herbivorax sp. ANBcel31]